MGEVAVADAAAELGVSAQRVRALIADGSLPARQVAGRWVLDSERLRRFEELRGPGRPMSPRNAWALVRMIEEGDAPGLSPAERSRLRRRLRSLPEIGELARSTRRRRDTRRWRVHRSVLRRADDAGVRTGASASIAGLIDVGRAEIYLRAQEIDALRRSLHAREVDASEPEEAANLVVHVPAEDLWPFEAGEAGPVAVALDLWESGEARSRRAARRLYDEALSAARFEVVAR